MLLESSCLPEPPMAPTPRRRARRTVEVRLSVSQSAIDPTILQIDYVARHVAATGKNWWQVALVGGIAIGALHLHEAPPARSASQSRRFGPARWVPPCDTPLRRRFRGRISSCSSARGLADGCTSGHGLSGTAQLAVGSMVAVDSDVCGRNCHCAACALAPHLAKRPSMSLISAIFVGVAMGIVFGFALEKSRVFEPGIIVGKTQLRNFIMLKVFLTAVATGAARSP